MLCESDWRGLYSGQWDLWSPESYAHPAKMAPGLAFRILLHLEQRGLLQPDGMVFDPMAGIGTTLLAAYMRGYETVGVELEPKFVALSQENIKRLVSKYPSPASSPRIIQGDARNLRELFQEHRDYLQGMVGVMSPPWLDATNPGLTEFMARGQETGKRHTGTGGNIRTHRDYLRGENTYGTTPGNVGNLVDRPLVALTSPPYGEAGITKQGAGPDQTFNDKYRSLQRGEITAQEWQGFLDKHVSGGGYGATEGQIGALPDRVAAITSPPWEAQSGGLAPPNADLKLLARHHGGIKRGLGETEGQLQNKDGASYLEAMAQVYAEIGKVASVLAVVVKDPTRDGKLRLLGEDTIRLLEATNWRLVCHHRALLFEESEQASLDGGSVKQPKGRLSFFKRLQYRKGGPVADSEHVLVAMR